MHARANTVAVPCRLGLLRYTYLYDVRVSDWYRITTYLPFLLYLQCVSLLPLSLVWYPAIKVTAVKFLSLKIFPPAMISVRIMKLGELKIHTVIELRFSSNFLFVRVTLTDINNRL